MSDIIEREGRFKSSDGIHEIYYRVWEPAEAPRAILQISHGMCEHIGRYDGFARDLCAAGIVVCANDHIGHGKSEPNEKELGYFGGKGSIFRLAEDLDLYAR